MHPHHRLCPDAGLRCDRTSDRAAVSPDRRARPTSRRRGARSIRQSARAKVASIELSWRVGAGHATSRPSAPTRRARAGSPGAGRWPRGRAEHRRHSGERRVEAEHACERRAQEQRSRRRRRDRVARQAEQRHVADGGRTSAACPAASRSARNRARRPSRAERAAHQVVLADRGAAGGHQQIERRRSRSRPRPQRRRLVRRDAEIDRLRRPRPRPWRRARGCWS